LAAQAHLIRSRAGMRLIAQLTIFNSGDFDRLRLYLAENYAPAAFDVQPLEARLDALRADFAAFGRLRIDRVIGAGEHQVIVALEAERGGFVLAQMVVSADYPHAVTHYAQGSV
jgi:hypothetical protein